VSTRGAPVIRVRLAGVSNVRKLRTRSCFAARFLAVTEEYCSTNNERTDRRSILHSEKNRGVSVLVSSTWRDQKIFMNHPASLDRYCRNFDELQLVKQTRGAGPFAFQRPDAFSIALVANDQALKRA